MLHKYFLLNFFTFFALTIHAQNEYNFAGDWKTYSLNNWPTPFTSDSTIERVDFVIERKNNVEKAYKTFNANGKLTAYVTFDKTGKEQPFVHMEHDSRGNLTKSTFYKKGKLAYTTLATYNAHNQPLTEIKRSKKGKQLLKKTWAYTASNCFDSSVLYKGESVKYKWKYKYYDACKKETSVLFDKHNKVIMTWRYDCKEEGEKLTKQKNTNQVCTWSKVSADTLTRVYETFNDKGELEKQVYKFTVNDTLPLEWRVYDKNNRLMRLHQYDKSYAKQTKYIYYKKGKPTYVSLREFEGNNLIAVREYKKGKLYFTQKFEYNKNNQIIVVDCFGTRNKKTYTAKLTYS